MKATEPSMTAMFTAVARGQHRLLHAPPWVLDDPFGLSLVGPGWRDIDTALTAAFGADLIAESIGFICGRSRYAEDRLAAGRFAQYVILGAGLDSFAWRRPDLLAELRVFEVDHPATQAWKRERMDLLALPVSDRHVFAPIDFRTDTLSAGLDAAGFDWGEPTLFSCLGVVPYLGVEAISAMLEAVSRAAPGSEVVLSYAVTGEFTDPMGERFREVIMRLAADAGEGLRTFLAPSDMDDLIRRSGLQPVENVCRDALRDRYFADRRDGLVPNAIEAVAVGVVPKD